MEHLTPWYKLPTAEARAKRFQQMDCAHVWEDGFFEGRTIIGLNGDGTHILGPELPYQKCSICGKYNS